MSASKTKAVVGLVSGIVAVLLGAAAVVGTLVTNSNMVTAVLAAGTVVVGITVCYLSATKIQDIKRKDIGDS